MTRGCNIWMICLKFIRYETSLTIFLLIDATDWNKISGDQKRFFIALSLYPLSFFANTPFKSKIYFSFQLRRTVNKWMGNFPCFSSSINISSTLIISIARVLINELSFCHKLRFYNSYILELYLKLIDRTHSLKYQRSTTSALNI